ncbi:DUF368 domain-containing protein [Halobacteriales archaeon Cl-PHB]
MGSADTVPGVSGGTIALITGIYERLITALTALDPRILGRVTSLHTAKGWRDLLDDLQEMDVFFLVVLGLGVMTAVVTLSRVVHAALGSYRAATFAFFFGLIAASAVILYRHIDVETVGQVLAGLVGVVFAFVVAGASSSGAFGHALPVVFVAGAIGITAMVLPGISGSFILLLLGQYEYMTGVLKEFVDGLLRVATGGVAESLVDNGLDVVTFIVGAFVGIVTISHVIRWALDHYRVATMTFLVSLMVGSLRLPVVEVRDNVGTLDAGAVLLVAVPALVGGGAVLLLDHYTDDLDAETL